MPVPGRLFSRSSSGSGRALLAARIYAAVLLGSPDMKEGAAPFAWGGGRVGIAGRAGRPDS